MLLPYVNEVPADSYRYRGRQAVDAFVKVMRIGKQYRMAKVSRCARISAFGMVVADWQALTPS